MTKLNQESKKERMNDSLMGVPTRSVKEQFFHRSRGVEGPVGSDLSVLDRGSLDGASLF